MCIQTDHGFEKFSNYKINKQAVLVYEPYLKTKKLGYWFIALNTQEYSNRNILKCKQELRGFPEDKNSNKRKVLILEFLKMLKMICKKAKSICKSQSSDL